MTWAQLVIEIKARGFTHMGSRVEQYLQDAYLLDICEDEDWPFLEASASGPAPLSIADLRAVEYVLDTTNGNCQLEPLKRARLVDSVNNDLTQVGTPRFYYITGGNTVNVQPVATDTITVAYWKVPSELSGEDEPLLPARFHSLIVDGAVARAYENSDDHELADAARAKFDGRFERMRASLGMLQHDADEDFVVVEDPGAL